MMAEHYHWLIATGIVNRRCVCCFECCSEDEYGCEQKKKK